MMKNFKGFAMGLVLGIGLAVSSIGFAQTATQGDAKKSDSCCATASCCCKGGSCSMKDHKEHKDQAMNHEGCCCCGGDSCDMKSHDMAEKPKS
jgi:hypothetical protein